jgi:hypothetical protein
MAGINGNVTFGIQPTGYSADNVSYAFPRQESRTNTLKSANDQLRYQVQWFYNPPNGSPVNEGVEPSAANFDSTALTGDVVNVVFRVYSNVRSGTSFPSDWELLGTIKQSRDIASKRFDGGIAALGHRFTIDVSGLVSDQLSYSLCPINKGTWQSTEYGGMNGGATMQDNVLSGYSPSGDPISDYNVSNNGTYRYLKVKANYEIINADGEIQTATGAITSNEITVINSVNQFSEDKTPYFKTFNIGNSGTNKYSLLTRSPNKTNSFKQIRVDEQAEFLQFYVDRADSTNIDAGTSTVGSMALKIETVENNSVVDTFYLRDFEDNLLTTSYISIYLSNVQKKMCIQNISPHYINNSGNVWLPSTPVPISSGSNFPYWNTYSGDKILSTTDWYRVSLVKISVFGSQTERRVSDYYSYSIDRESDNLAYGFVRFHWLNSMGGIDSYTAKRDIVEAITISRGVIERNSADRTWYQNNTSLSGTPLVDGTYHSDTMRGGNLYKGGREVSNVNADKSLSVYTEPLNKPNAEWLQGMLLSPNVWIEKDTEATQEGNTLNPYLRPSAKGYIPVIITNSDAETVNQSNGLVRFNIEYTLAHKVQTQRN